MSSSETYVSDKLLWGNYAFPSTVGMRGHVAPLRRSGESGRIKLVLYCLAVEFRTGSSVF